MGSVVFPWQIPREPRLAKRRVLAGGERCHQCNPADIAGQSGQGGLSATAFFLSPVGVSPTQAPDPGLGKAGRESADCQGWAAVSYMAGTTFPLPPRSSPWKPLQLHVKVPGGSAPGAPAGTCQGPLSRAAAVGSGAQAPESTFPGLVRGRAGARLGGGSAGKSHSGSFSTLTRG